MLNSFHHISTRWKLPALAIVAVALVAILTGVATSQRTYDRNLATLHELQQQNQADTLFRSDSLQRRLAAYFDRRAYMPGGWLHPTRTANERMLAHYLLGRALADMGDAPAAITAYKEAAACADTTAVDCDYPVLRSVHGQMACVFDRQGLTDLAISSLRAVQKYDSIIGDTFDILATYPLISSAYLIQGDTVAALDQALTAIRLCHEYGKEELIPNAMVQMMAVYLDKYQYAETRLMLAAIRHSPYFFTDTETVVPGRELLYYYLGRYYDGIGRLDSAECFFRKVLSAGYKEAGYRGLLSVFAQQKASDSISYYAQCFASANDDMHREMRTHDVAQVNKLYDYTHHLGEMSQSQGKIIFYQRAFLVTLLIMALAMLSVHNFMSATARKRRQRIRALLRRYAEALSAAEVIQANTSLSLERAKAEIAQLKARDVLPFLKESNIVGEFREMAARPDINGLPTQPMWESLLETCNPFLEKLYKDVHNMPKLNILDLEICVMTILDFKTGEIASLMGVSKQNINKMKARINKSIFQNEGATGLSEALKTTYLGR